MTAGLRKGKGRFGSKYKGLEIIHTVFSGNAIKVTGEELNSFAPHFSFFSVCPPPSISVLNCYPTDKEGDKLSHVGK